MILKPELNDIKNICYYLGRIILGIGLTMFLPFIAGVILFHEPDPALDFLISANIAIFIGLVLSWLCKTNKNLHIGPAMVVIALSWLLAMALSAIPLLLSGHYKSFLDACFETMSGFTTTGLTLVQDLDHLSRTHNLWRHLGPFLGGQGIAIVAISFLVSGAGGSLNLYFGEARDEKLVPNVIGTARFIWVISIAYLILGAIILGLVGISIGLKPQSAFFHAVCIFMAGFDTAGFSPQSPNILYYHSLMFEIVTIFFMVIGSFNFNLHYQIWRGNFKEICKNIEMRTLLFVAMIVTLITLAGLERFGVYSDGMVLFRKGFFQVISGQTTTGYMTIYAQQFIKEWGDLALTGIILSMALGGCVCSTAGGVKMLRVGIIYKAFRQDIKRTMLSSSAIVVEKFHHIKTVFIEDKQVRAVFIVTLGYFFLYGLGTLVGVALGYPFLEALFESTSAAANVGLSCGITDTSMPSILKVTYIIEMWAGRLELISVFALVGFCVAIVKGKRK
ncbi:MAG: TrkH family potassium uptake protein [Candidatus Omnitrophica bacterium]|jgi:trk system potassium uptake protein TrkH|nr:TrkH family potassium uptake protein [Candidatus Omnitrophota bacterium]